MERRVTSETKDHFIHLWSNIKDPQELAENLDEYETFKRPTKKYWTPRRNLENKIEKPKVFERERAETKPTKSKNNWKGKT